MLPLPFRVQFHRVDHRVVRCEIDRHSACRFSDPLFHHGNIDRRGTRISDDAGAVLTVLDRTRVIIQIKLLDPVHNFDSVVVLVQIRKGVLPLAFLIQDRLRDSRSVGQQIHRYALRLGPNPHLGDGDGHLAGDRVREGEACLYGSASGLAVSRHVFLSHIVHDLVSVSLVVLRQTGESMLPLTFRVQFHRVDHRVIRCEIDRHCIRRFSDPLFRYGNIDRRGVRIREGKTCLHSSASGLAVSRHVFLGHIVHDLMSVRVVVLRQTGEGMLPLPFRA